MCIELEIYNLEQFDTKRELLETMLMKTKRIYYLKLQNSRKIQNKKTQRTKQKRDTLFKA